MPHSRYLSTQRRRSPSERKRVSAYVRRTSSRPPAGEATFDFGYPDIGCDTFGIITGDPTHKRYDPMGFGRGGRRDLERKALVHDELDRRMSSGDVRGALMLCEMSIPPTAADDLDLCEPCDKIADEVLP